MSWGSEIRPASKLDREEAVELSRQLHFQGAKAAVYLDETRVLCGQGDTHPYVQAMVRRGIRALEENGIKSGHHPSADEIFQAITHGDEEHREWLKEALDAIFAGTPVPPPRGKGTMAVSY